MMHMPSLQIFHSNKRKLVIIGFIGIGCILTYCTYSLYISHKTEHNEYKVLSHKDRMERYKASVNNLELETQTKISNIKDSREIITLQSDQKENATKILTDYALQKAKHSSDINKLNGILKNISNKNCISKLKELNILSEIFVDCNEFIRWRNRNKIATIISNENGANKINYNQQKGIKQIKMYAFTSINNEILTKTTKQQKDIFENLLVMSIKECSFNIYRFEFVLSNVNNNLLIKIIDLFLSLNNVPEILMLSSNKITEKGINKIIELIQGNKKQLKEIRFNNCINFDIPYCVSENICKAMEINEHILNISFDAKYNQHKQQIHKLTLRNNDTFRKLNK